MARSAFFSYPISLSAAILAVVSAGAAAAQPVSGQWTRSQGGAIIDLLELVPKNGGSVITLREGPGRPVYASGFCTALCDRWVCGVRNASGKTGLIELSSRGTALHYRSFYDDGATVWQGDFVGSQGSPTAGTPVAVQPGPATTVAAPGASQWTRTEGGSVVDVLELTPNGGSYQLALREGFGKPVYASGTCTLAGATYNCNSRSASGMTGQIVLTVSGNSLHYRSSYEGGRRIWEGNFIRSSPPRS